MIKVGITGGIGVGKTYICNILKKMGYSIFSSDQVSKKIVSENIFVRDQIRNFFGEDIIENEMISRKKKLRITQLILLISGISIIFFILVLFLS